MFVTLWVAVMQVLGDLCSGLLDCGLRMVSGFGECWCGAASAGLWCFELAGVCLRLLFRVVMI